MAQRMSIQKPLLIVLAVLIVGFLLWPPFYVVDQRELSVVIRFGKPGRAAVEPGFYWKMPFIERVQKLPSTRQFWRGAVLPDLPTKDDKKIEVVPWAMWRIKDPDVFVRRMRTIDNAETRIADFARGAIRDVVTQYDLAELVRSSKRVLDSGTSSESAKSQLPPQSEAVVGAMSQPNAPSGPIQYGREHILNEIREEARNRLKSGQEEDDVQRGIELVDIGISQIEFVDSVRTKTFDRWIAERNAVSASILNHGERMKQEIINLAKKEVQEIEGEGQQKANEIKGNADAEVIRKYAEAINEVGDFYTFQRTLEAYESAIDDDTKLILTTDSLFLKFLKELPNIDSTTD